MPPRSSDKLLPANLELIESFLEMMASEGGAAKNTIESYRRDLKDLAASAKTYSLTSLSENNIRNYFKKLSAKKTSPATVSRRLSAYRKFYRFLLTEKLSKEDPTRAIDFPKRGLKLPKFLSEEESDKLIAAVKDNAMLLAMLELLYASGLRVSELVSLKPGNIAKQPGGKKIGNHLVVIGKGSKERMLPFGESAREALENYLQSPRVSEIKWLFPALRKGKTGHITRQGFALMMKEAAIKAGINPARVSPHVMRHSFATHLLSHNADLRVVQELLGHSDISTTQIYTHVVKDKLVEVVEKHHPLSRKRKG